MTAAPLPVSLYFTPKWWDAHYHARTPRPEHPSETALERLYLGRQRFLFEIFGAWGLGAERPELGAGQIATVIRRGFDLIPVLLGTQLDFAERARSGLSNRFWPGDWWERRRTEKRDRVDPVVGSRGLP